MDRRTEDRNPEDRIRNEILELKRRYQLSSLAMDKVEKEMIYGALEIKDIGLGEGSVLVDEKTQRGNELIWQQYTGLKDNENKELYFYDAIKTYAGNRLLGTMVIKSLSDLVGLINAIEESGINFKIIGNTFENPELLNK